jgi:ABC-type nitrate/sulfonate/bicarbonate transport system substrate-binding protein
MRSNRLSRREVLTSIAGTGIISSAGCISSFGSSTGKSNEFATARLATGSTSLVAPIIDKGLDDEYGFELKIILRNTISSYYGDFVSGKYKALPMGIGAAANRYNRGVNLKIVGGFARTSSFWVTNDKSIQSASDFEGETIAVPLGSGGFAPGAAVVRRKTGKTVKELAGQVINAPGPANPLLELSAGSATVALSWEPALSSFLLKEKTNIQLMMNVRKQYKKIYGIEPWQLVWAVKDSLESDNVQGLLKASQEVDEMYEYNTEKAIEIVVDKTKNKPKSLNKALRSNRLQYDLKPINDVKHSVQKQLKVAESTGLINKVPDSGIFTTVGEH